MCPLHLGFNAGGMQGFRYVLFRPLVRFCFRKEFVRGAVHDGRACVPSALADHARLTVRSLPHFLFVFVLPCMFAVVFAWARGGECPPPSIAAHRLCIVHVLSAVP